PMFLNDGHLRLCRSQRCCYPSCFLPCSRFMRSRFPAHESIALNGAVWRSKASNLIPGAIVPNHTVRPLVPCFCAFNRVSLWTLPPVVVVSLWCGVAPGRVAPGSRLPVWGSGALPTVGAGRWWVLPHYWRGYTVGCPLWWGLPCSGYCRIVGACPLLGLSHCGC